MKCGVSDAGLRGRSGNGPGRSVPPSSPFRSWRWIIRRSRYGLLPSAPGVDRKGLLSVWLTLLVSGSQAACAVVL